MAKEAEYQAEWLVAVKAKIDDYKQLVKFRLNMLVVVSAILSYFIAASGWGRWQEVLLLALGGFLVTGASNVLNQVLEKDFDKLMVRTQNRPLAKGRVTISEAVLSAGLMSLVGITLLAMLSPWAGILGAFSLVLYAFLYTPLKRVSPVSVPVGAVPGALPALIGVVAYTNTVESLGLLLFAMMFFWQFPHFWSIAELGREDYQKANFKLIEETTTARKLGVQSLILAAFLIPVSIGLYYYLHIGILSLIIMLLITIIYMWLSYVFSRRQTRKSALAVMFSSFFYLPIFMGVMILEQWLF